MLIPMATFDPTSDADLVKASDHVAYECKMLRRTFDMLWRLVADPAKMGTTPGLRQALMESFIIHARALRYFFWTSAADRKHSLDPLATDYINDWLTKVPACTITQDEYNRMHREIAHISAARFDLKPGEPQWDFAKILGALNPAIDLFFEKVDPERLSQDVRASIQQQPGAGAFKSVRVQLTVDSLACSNVADQQSFVLHIPGKA